MASNQWLTTKDVTDFAAKQGIHLDALPADEKTLSQLATELKRKKMCHGYINTVARDPFHIKHRDGYAESDTLLCVARRATDSQMIGFVMMAKVFQRSKHMPFPPKIDHAKLQKPNPNISVLLDICAADTQSRAQTGRKFSGMRGTGPLLMYWALTHSGRDGMVLFPARKEAKKLKFSLDMEGLAPGSSGDFDEPAKHQTIFQHFNVEFPPLDMMTVSGLKFYKKIGFRPVTVINTQLPRNLQNKSEYQTFLMYRSTLPTRREADTMLARYFSRHLLTRHTLSDDDMVDPMLETSNGLAMDDPMPTLSPFDEFDNPLKFDEFENPLKFDDVYHTPSTDGPDLPDVVMRRPASKSRSKSKAKAKPKPVPKPATKSRSNSKAKPKPIPKPVPKSRSKSKAKPKPVAKSRSKSKAKAKAKPTSKSRSKANSKSKSKSKRRRESKLAKERRKTRRRGMYCGPQTPAPDGRALGDRYSCFQNGISVGYAIAKNHTPQKGGPKGGGQGRR
jgi:hypothetical protein